GDHGAAEQAAIGYQPADRERCSAAGILRDRVKGRRSEELERTEPRPLCRIDEGIEERIGDRDRDTAHRVIRRGEKGELIADGEGFDRDELSGGRPGERYEARDENGVTRKTGHIALEVALEG